MSDFTTIITRDEGELLIRVEYNFYPGQRSRGFDEPDEEASVEIVNVVHIKTGIPFSLSPSETKLVEKEIWEYIANDVDTP